MIARLTDLTVHSRDGVVLDHLDLTVMPGRITALIGESGCGKSLVAAALCGVLPPGLRATGTVTFGDRTIRPHDRLWTTLRGHVVGLVPQSAATSFTPVRTIGAQLREIVSVLGSAHTPDQLCAAAALDPSSLELFPHELSGGMAQRAAVAAAVAADPPILIADEPTSALDADAAALVLTTLRRRADMGAAVVVITHDLPSLLAVGCDTVAVMRAGRIVAAGPVSSSTPNPDTVLPIPGSDPAPEDLQEYIRAFFEEVR